MASINIKVAGKIATNMTPGEVIICGNSGYTVAFEFDSEWTSKTDRTARFVYIKDGRSVYQDVEFTGDTVQVPVVSGIEYVQVGVFAGDLQTTTPAKVLCRRSILCLAENEALTILDKEQLQGIMATAKATAQRAEDAQQAAEAALAALHGKAGEDAPAIVCTATGEIITVTDGAQRPLRGLTIYGKTTQNGTPTPESPVALQSLGADGSIGVTVAVKNLWDEETVSGYWQSSNGKFVSDSNQLASKNMIPVCSAIYTTSSSGAMELRFYDRNKNYISGTSVWSQPATVEPPANACYMHINLKSGYGTEYKNDVCISAVPTAYDPYKPIQALTVSTPNGLNGIGQYRDYIDFQRGVYVKRIAKKIFDGTESFNFYHNRFSYYHENETSVPYTEKAYCSHYPYNTTVFSDTANEIGFLSNINNIYIRLGSGSTITTAAQFREFLSAQYAAGTPVTVAYPLAEPIETPLTEEQLGAFAALHSNKPNTTVMNDAGADMALEYAADTKLYIDNKFNELAAAIVNNA